MGKLFYLALLASIFISCKKENPTTEFEKTITKNDSVKSGIDTLTFEIKKFEKYSIHKSDTTKIKIEVPFFKSKSVVTDSIDKLLLKRINSIFTNDSLHEPRNFDEICNNFITDYNKFLKEDVDYFTAWEGIANATINYQSSKLLNLTVDFYAFTGGAHGNGASFSFFIDTKTGKQIKKENLFSNLKGFTKLAEEKFRKQQDIPKNANINETGYWFTNEVFHLPKNIFLTKEGVKLVYNQYEVASYAEGPIELLISYNEADKYLKIK